MLASTSTSTATIFALTSLGVTGIAEFVYFAIFFFIWLVVGWVIILGLRPIWLIIK